MPQPRKPTALKIAQGNPGKRPLNLNEPTPPAGVPVMPKGLSPAARKEWKAIVPELLKLGTLTVVDGKALAAYCEAFAMWEQARKEIKKHGLVIEGKAINAQKEIISTGLRKNPAVAIAFEALRAMKSYLVEFGLTPASRSRLSVEPPAKEDDPVAKFFAGNANEELAKA